MANTRSNLPNPFRIHGVVSGDAFADRQDELARIASALTEAGGKLLVHGRRRMGKTSTILRAMEGVTEAGGHALYVDFSTASSMADLCNRILAAAGATLGRSLRDFITDIVSRVKVSITLTPDPASGLLLFGLDM